MIVHNDPIAEAWRVLSIRWLHHIRYQRGTIICYVTDERWAFSLCKSLDHLMIDGQIDEAQRNEMYSRLFQDLSDQEREDMMYFGYRWPLNFDGAIARAKFCEMQFNKFKRVQGTLF